MKVAIYCRLSEEDKNKRTETQDSESIQNQKSLLIQYAIEHQWEVYQIYSDDDYTGADRNRPAFNQLLSDAEQRNFDIVLCKTQSRFTRELEMVESIIHGKFIEWGIRFISVVDNADTALKGNKKSRQINGLINEWYLEDMSDNIKSVLTNRRKNGFHIGAFALYGYQKDPEQKGHLIVDEEAAAVVREVFTLFSQGYGKTAIARMLNERGIPNPTEYKRLHGLRYQPPKTKNSTLWRYFAISDMLTNEIYIGNLVQGKYGSISYKSKVNKPLPKERWIRVENTHEPIVDRELWDRVQAMVEQKAKPFTAGTVGLFAKKVRCMSCGYVMRSQKNRGKHYLQCATRHTAKGACPGAFISVSVLEQLVLTQLRQLAVEYLDTGELEERVQFQDRTGEQREKLLRSLERDRKQLDTCNKGIKSLYLDKVKGLITDEDFLEFSKEFYRDRERLQAQISTAQTELDSLAEKMQTAQQRREKIEQYVNVKQLTRPMVESLIDCIYVGARDPQTKQRKIQIHWNF